MLYEEIVATGSPDIRRFAGRLDEWVAETGWNTRTTPKTLQVTAPGSGLGFSFCPEWDAVEVSLTEIRQHGFTAQAEDILSRLAAITEVPLTERSPKVPVSSILEHWDVFFGDILPAYLEALERAAAAAGRAPGTERRTGAR